MGEIIPRVWTRVRVRVEDRVRLELDFELVFELKIEFDLEINKWTIGNKFTRGVGEDKQRPNKRKQTNQIKKIISFPGFVARQQSIFFHLSFLKIKNKL